MNAHPLISHGFFEPFCAHGILYGLPRCFYVMMRDRQVFETVHRGDEYVFIGARKKNVFNL